MKATLLTLLLFAGLTSYGQSIKSLITSGVLQPSLYTDSLLKNTSAHPVPDALTFYKPQITTTSWTFSSNQSFKPAMTVSSPNSLGVIKVYIDRKQITWTSDSTFIIRSK